VVEPIIFPADYGYGPGFARFPRKRNAARTKLTGSAKEFGAPWLADSVVRSGIAFLKSLRSPVNWGGLDHHREPAATRIEPTGWGSIAEKETGTHRVRCWSSAGKNMSLSYETAISTDSSSDNFKPPCGDSEP
jgi:hypothetical protein